MRTKLEQCVEQMKQTCSTALLDYKEARQLIRDYESQEEYLSTYDTRAVLLIDRLEQKIPGYASELVQSKDYYVDKINEAFVHFIICELNIVSSQIKNRYKRNLIQPIEKDYFGLIAKSLNISKEYDQDYRVVTTCDEEGQNSSENYEFGDDSSSSEEVYFMRDTHEFNDTCDLNPIEEERLTPDSHDDILDVCLRFLISVSCNKRHLLHTGLLSVTQYRSSNELNLAIAESCRAYVNQVKASVTSFSSWFKTPQMLVWGMDQSPGGILDLSHSEVIYLFDEDRWEVLATVYMLTNKSTLILSTLALVGMNMDTIGNAFSKTGASVNTLDLRNFSSLFYVNTNAGELGEFLGTMNVKTLDLSYNYLEMLTRQEGAEWMKTLAIMLKKGKVRKINLSNNDLYKLDAPLWKQLCDCLGNTELESVEIDNINSHNMAMLRSALKKPSVASDSFFYHGKKTDSRGASDCYFRPTSS